MLKAALFKLNSIFSGGIGLSSLFAADGDVVSTFDVTEIYSGTFSLITNFFINGIVKLIYIICTFVMSLIDFMQFIIMAILGLDVSIDDYVLIDYNNPLIKIISTDTFTKTFRLLIGIAIVLIIVFTIFAIVKSEYNYAANDGPNVSKGRIFSRTLRSFFVMSIFPMFFLLMVVLVNAILAGFNDILKTDNKNTTLGGQIFISSAYGANNYRNYAQADKRIPISLNFNDPISSGRDVGYTTEQLRQIYKEFEVRGKELYNNFADVDFGSFADTVTYRNNKVINQSSYSGYENFVCTREQYYVMADFMDYAVKSNLKYYVKNVADTDIDWGYVDSTIFNREAGTLTITYRDASYLNDGESYTVVYSPESLDVSTPISDALKTISSLLAIGDYEDNTFNILNRLEDSINVVEWGTDKALIKFSDSIDLADINNAKETDKIIFYEKHKFKYNNTLNYTLSELSEGVTLPVYKLEKRQYQASTASFVTFEEHYVVRINGTLYAVEENKDKPYDDNGYVDYYYTLVDPTISTTLTVDTTITDYTTYTKDINDAWSEIIFEKTNGTKEMDIPAEGLIYDYNDNGKYEPEDGDRYQDENANGLWDAGYTSYIIYDDLLTESIKQISWPQKLINDLQVIYADININQLITTNKWLDQLGEYHYSDSGAFSGENNISTALIHPLGLIMSEFFLGEVEEADNSNAFGSLMFNSKFDDETIKALLLSTMGEDDYFQLKAEIEYFCEIFNVYMGPVLDEIAYYENFDLKSGNEASVQLYAYKAYLASVLLSSSTAEWMFDTANNLLGNANFIRDIYVSVLDDDHFGEYKKFAEFKSACTSCGGDGINDDGKDCHAGCSGCDGLGANGLIPCTTVNECRKDNAAYEIIRLYEAQKKLLEEQGIKEDDRDYPEYMIALKEYIFGDDNAFNGRLDKVLSSFLSPIAREKKIVDAYVKVKEAYDDIMDECDSNTKEMINNVIIIPNAKYVAVDRSGDTKNLMNNTITGSFNQGSGDGIVSIKNEGSSDELTRTQTATSTKNLLNMIENMRKTLSKQTLSEDIKNALENYYKAIENYVEIKVENLQEDTSYQLVGKRDDLVKDLDDYKKIIKQRLKAIYSSDDFKATLKKVGCTSEDCTSEDCNCTSDVMISAVIMLLELNINAQVDEIVEAISNANEVGDWEGTAVANIEITNLKNLWDSIKTLFTDFDVDKFWDSFQNYIFKVIIGENTTATAAETQYHYIYLDKYEPAFVNYYNAVRTIDRLDRYNITYAISTLYSQNASTEFEVTVNNKAYTVGQNFTQAKFIEYVCGAEYLKTLDYETVFVDDDYKGLISMKTDGTLIGSFNTLQKFLVELGDISATLGQMTNFVNLASNAYDEVLIGAQDEDSTNLSKHILNWILTDTEDYLASDLICALFGIDSIVGKINVVSGQYEYDDSDDTTTNVSCATYEEAYKAAVRFTAMAKIKNDSDDENNRILNNVLSYLFLTEANESKKNYVDYTKLTLKELRLRAFDMLINYEEQEGESVEQNQKRYLAVLALACADWYMEEEGTGVRRSAQNNSWNVDKKSEIDGLTIDKQSQATILRLAGLENRPYEELVGAEYTINFDRNGVDEANGDVFIICTYDDERQVYVPFLMGNTAKYDFDTKKGYNEIRHFMTEKTWQEDYGYYETNTQYYMDEKFYPIVAKGVITSDGLPTAIRQVGDDIEYYRDDVVIHDVSETGLSTYYVSVDQVAVHQTAVSYIANSFSKLFTGKSLVENIVSNIPKFAAHSDFSFCYGTETKVIQTSKNGSVAAHYMFNENVCISMDNLYNVNEINLLVLLIGTWTLFIAIWKALWAVIQRTFDVAVLYLMGPVAISTMALRGDGTDDKGNIVESQQDAYTKWKGTLTEKLLSVFSLSIGFNIFFIVVPIISNVNLFATQAEFNSALTISSVFKHVDISYINEVARLVLTAAAAYLTTRATDLFTSLMKITNAFNEGEQTFEYVKNTVNELGDHISGQYMMDKVEGTIDSLKNTIPGYKFMEKTAGAVQEIGNKAVSKGAELYLMLKGVPKDQAKQMSQALYDSMKEKQKAKEKLKTKRTKARQERENKRKGKKGA